MRHTWGAGQGAGRRREWEEQSSGFHENNFQTAHFLSFEVQRLMHNRKFLYFSNIPWPPTVRSLQCVMFLYVGAWFTWNGNVLLPSFPVTNHTIGANHLASRAFKNEGNTAHLCQSHCYLWLEVASVHLHPKVFFFWCFYAFSLEIH